jgi:phosphatidylserine/phosphatidylglycerophosphate/cardiolipin synthase-like enzyme
VEECAGTHAIYLVGAQKSTADLGGGNSEPVRRMEDARIVIPSLCFQFLLHYILRTMKTIILGFVFTLLFMPCNAQIAGYPDFELVESTPTETTLDNPDIRNAREVWIEMIQGARESLDFEEFYISNHPGEQLEDVLNAVFQAARRGVKIRFIVDAGMYKTYPEMVDSLERQSNISVRIIDYRKLAGGIQHSKYFIVDGKEAFIGSQNFDWRALNQIHELGVRIRNTEAASVYEGLFDLDWPLALKNDPTQVPEYLHHTTYPMPIRVVEGAGDTLTYMPTCSPKVLDPDTTLWDETNIVKIIDGANREVMLQFLTYSPLTYGKGVYTVLNDALFRAVRRGVHVKLIVSDWEKVPRQIEQLKLLAATPNIEVKFSSIPDLPNRYISYARVEHCKYIVADSSSCWIGSSNAEKSYFYNTRNVGVVVWNTKVAGILRRVFMKDWNGPYTELVHQEGEYKPREHGEKK